MNKKSLILICLTAAFGFSTIATQGAANNKPVSPRSLGFFHGLHLLGFHHKSETLVATAKLGKTIGMPHVTFTDSDDTECRFIVKVDKGFKPYGYFLSWNPISQYLLTSNYEGIEAAKEIIEEALKNKAVLNKVAIHGIVVSQFPVLRTNEQIQNHLKESVAFSKLPKWINSHNLDKRQLQFAIKAFNKIGFQMNFDRFPLDNAITANKLSTNSSGISPYLGNAWKGYLIVISESGIKLSYSSLDQFDDGITRLLELAQMGKEKGKLPSNIVLTNLPHVLSVTDVVKK